MKSTTNVFLEGLRTDLYPLSTSQQVLTDALNATMITYNGNEMMLQNDMGNTLIQDSATGGIMGLSPGFIPTGIKEHGGIMYITSVNKDGYGEIGTIPSPIIRDIYKDLISIPINQRIPISGEKILEISNKLYPADKFIANLQMSIETDQIKGAYLKELETDPSDITLCRKVLRDGETNTICTPIISYAEDRNKEPELFSKKGIYRMRLFSTSNGQEQTEADLLSAQSYNGGISNYWFTHSSTPAEIFPNDLLSATLSGLLKQVPSDSKPGKLAIRLDPEGVQSFNILPRKKEPINTPITFKYMDEEGVANYRTFFPGFYYSTDSGIYINKIDNIKVINESNGLAVPIHSPYGDDITEFSFDYYNWNDKTAPYVTIAVNDKFLTSKEMQPALWNNNINPQTLSLDDTNIFILSTIPSIKKHTTTDFISSSEKDESPHSGVFCAELGTQDAAWYRLELDYVDQYGEKLGTFTTRFNPKVNDAFKTNLSCDGIDTAKSIAFKDTLEYKLPAVSMTLTKEEGSVKYQRLITIDNDTEPSVDLEKTVGFKPGTHYLPAIGRKSANFKYTCNIAGQEVTNWWDSIKKYTNKILGYLYQTDNLYPVKEQPISPKKTQLTATIDKVTTYFELKKDENYDDTEAYTYGIRGFHRHFKEDEIGDYGSIAVPSMGMLGASSYWTHLYINNKLVYPIALNANGPDDWGYNSDLPSFSDSSSASYYTLSTHNPHYFKNTDFSEFSEFSEFKAKFDVFSSVIRLAKGYKSIPTSLPIKFGYIYYANHLTDADYAVYEEAPGQDPKYLTIQMTLPEDSWTKDWPLKILRPSYNLIPYFTLLGKNDQGNNCFVSKLYYSDMLWFESNLELSTEDGCPVNYIVADNITSVPTSDTGISYTLPEIKKGNSITSFSAKSLEAGVYVFNIIPDIATGPLLVKGYSKCTVSISGESTDLEGIVRWSGSTQLYRINNDAGFYSEYGNLEKHYWPIVIILSGESDVSITCELTNGKILTYQSVGLYKVLNADMKALQSLTSKVMLYCDYLKHIDKTAPDRNVEPNEYYKYVQKNGVFLRQAFSYKEAIYQDAAAPETITDGGHPFTTNAIYTPTNAYEINFMLDWSEDYYKKLNATATCMYMPNSDFTRCKYFPKSAADPLNSILPEWTEIRTLN